MCELSKNIRFCTCEDDKPFYSLAYKWEILRRGSDIFKIGTVSYKDIENKASQINTTTLLEKLTTSDCFDFDYSPKIDDKFNVFLLSNKDSKQYLEFYFIYQLNGWEVFSIEHKLKEVLGSLEEGNYYTLKEGEVKQPYQ